MNHRQYSRNSQDLDTHELPHKFQCNAATRCYYNKLFCSRINDDNNSVYNVFISSCTHLYLSSYLLSSVFSTSPILFCESNSSPPPPLLHKFYQFWSAFSLLSFYRIRYLFMFGQCILSHSVDMTMPY